MKRYREQIFGAFFQKKNGWLSEAGKAAIPGVDGPDGAFGWAGIAGHPATDLGAGKGD